MTIAGLFSVERSDRRSDLLFCDLNPNNRCNKNYDDTKLQIVRVTALFPKPASVTDYL